MSHSYHAKFILRKSKVNSKGLSPVALQLFVNTERIRLSSGIHLAAENWDPIKQQAIGRARSALSKAEAADTNLLLSALLRKANSIFYEHRLRDQPLTKELMLAEMSNASSRNDFHAWVLKRIDELNGVRSNKTLSMYRTTFRALKEFSPTIRYADLTCDLVERWERWLKVERGLGLNARGKYHRHLKTFTRHLAHSVKGIPNIYAQFKVRQVQGEKVYLAKHEVQTLIRLYEANALGDHLQDSLGMFLFSCMTGLRFSDLITVRHEQIFDGYLQFMPVKTQGIEKRVEVPITEQMMRYVPTAKGALFRRISNQHYGRNLKEIARVAGIRKRVSAHVGRHTFASRFIAQNGSPPVLQRILGHSKIETTMIYVHLSKQRIEEERSVIEVMYNSEKPLETAGNAE